MPRRILQGEVVSHACDKSVVVEVARRVMHPIYKKFVKKSQRFMAHDATNNFQIGNTVYIKECRPFSKRKRWEVLGTKDE